MEKVKKIFITGGAGFIGRHLSLELLSKNFKVVIFDNFTTSSKAGLEKSKKLTVVEGDVRNLKQIKESIIKHVPDFIFHLAAIHYIPYCIKSPNETKAVNVEGTKNILKVVSKMEHKPTIIFTSSAAVYKKSRKALKETSPLKSSEIYGQTKIEGENIIRQYSSDSNINYKIVRLFNVYGPGNKTPHIIPNIIKQLNNRIIKIGNYTPKRDFVFVEDVVSALIKIMHDKSDERIYNIGTGKEYSIKKITEIFRELLGEIEFVFDKNLYRKNERLNLKADISKIKSHLHWGPKVNLREGIKKVLKKEGYLVQ